MSQSQATSLTGLQPKCEACGFVDDPSSEALMRQGRRGYPNPLVRAPILCVKHRDNLIALVQKVDEHNAAQVVPASESTPAGSN